jgi:hypothetical protein
MERGKCRSCPATVAWATTAKGKAQPLDVTPERRIVRAILPSPAVKMERRIVVAYDAGTGEHRAIVVESWPLGAGVVGDEVDTYMPHHATCPRAERWRRKQ